MADLAASDVTVTIQKVGPIAGTYQRRNLVKIDYGDGAKTYPANGVPMPSAEKFGFKRELQDLILIDPVSADGILYKYDRANKKIRHYFPTQQTAGAGNRAGVEYTGASTVVAAQTIYAEAVGW